MKKITWLKPDSRNSIKENCTIIGGDICILDHLDLENERVEDFFPLWNNCLLRVVSGALETNFLASVCSEILQGQEIIQSA